MPTLPHARTHENDIWNPPAWALGKTVSLPIGKAAARLGICNETLNRHADEWGLTVLRRNDKARYFLIAELDQLIERGRQLNGSDIRKARKGRRDALETMGKRRK